MKPAGMAILMMIFMAIPIAVYAQEEAAVKISPLNDHIYKLSYNVGYNVNMVASVGDDGILLVDTGEKEKADQLKAVILTFGKGLPKIIVNTHAHVDHTGGNAVFGDEPLIIAHDILRTRLRSGSYLFNEFPDAALPDITFTDSLCLYFNREKIMLYAFPGSHDDNDILVLFTDSRIAAAGDLLYTNGFPSYEEMTGSVLGYRDVVPRIIEALPDDVTIVTGHTSDGNIETTRAFHQAIVKSAEIVRAALEKGESYETMQKEGILNEWAHFTESYISLDEWLQELIDEFEPRPVQKTLYEPIYHALKDSGVDAAIARYYSLKENDYDEYRFVDNDVMFMADKLSRAGKIPEAIAMWGLCIKEFPQSPYTWYSYYNLGKLYAASGQKDIALDNFRKSLEVNPDNPHAAEKIKDLKNK